MVRPSLPPGTECGSSSHQGVQLCIFLEGRDREGTSRAGEPKRTRHCTEHLGGASAHSSARGAGPLPVAWQGQYILRRGVKELLPGAEPLWPDSMSQTLIGQGHFRSTLPPSDNTGPTSTDLSPRGEQSCSRSRPRCPPTLGIWSSWRTDFNNCPNQGCSTALSFLRKPPLADFESPQTQGQSQTQQGDTANPGRLGHRGGARFCSSPHTHTPRTCLPTSAQRPDSSRLCAQKKAPWRQRGQRKWARSAHVARWRTQH